MSIGAVLRSLLGTGRSAPFPPLSPEEPLIAIGDIHGRYDLMLRLFDKMAQRPEVSRMVFLGDYVDRGENSAEVLKALHWLQINTEGVICLRGNHEEMLLSVLHDPVRHGSGWLQHGGRQTLASYGIYPPSPDAAEADWLAMQERLQACMGADLITWLSGLPAIWQSGNVALVHAGADPARPMTEQEEADLVWGHRNFLRHPRQDGVWVIHGHTITEQIIPTQGRLGIDTGAFATGRLSAAFINHDSVDILQA